MVNRRTFQFGLIALFVFTLVIAVVLRIWAPRLEFERLLSGNASRSVERIMITGRGRRLIFGSAQAVDYFRHGFIRSTRGGRAYREDYEAGIPPRKYKSYTMHVRTASGTYSVDCQISGQDCCMYVPFEESIADGEEPNRRFDFVKPVPPDVQQGLDFFFADIEIGEKTVELVLSENR